ncbi:MAG: hypothetical protein QM504_18745 [Pseudomonadota bacterium]
MQAFDISWSAIIKIMLAGAFSYVVLPALLVVRDLFLHKIIGKLILTDGLYAKIRMCEDDRWFLNNKYNKSVEVSYGQNNAVYKLDNIKVDFDTLTEYEKNRNFHSKRFEYANAKIVMSHNLITWLTRHYKQADGANPIPSLRERYYETAGRHEEKDE